MSSILAISCNVNVISSRRLLAIPSVRPVVGNAPRPISCFSVIGIFWSPRSLFSQEIPTAKRLASGRGSRVRSSSKETQIVGNRGSVWLSSSAFAQERPRLGCGVVRICATEAASRGYGTCSRKGRAGDRVLVRRSSNSGVCGLSSFRRTCEEKNHYHYGNESSLGTLESRRSGDGRWRLAALSHRGGNCVVSRNSSRACRGKAVRCASSRVYGLSAGRRKRRSGKSEGMELFKPQLMDTVPFQFLYEYHTTPLRAVKDSISPICFFGFGQVKPVVEVVQAGDPVLHEPAQEVRPEEIGSARIEKIINDMVATMRNAPGVGLAAPQIGVQLQIIVLEDTTELMSYCSPEECEAQQRSPFDLLVIINPTLKAKNGSDSAMFFEGCLSVEGYRALVERDLEVEVTGLGRDGRPIHVEASGWKARILQHECDHLAGNLYVDKMVPRTFRTKDNLRLPLPAGCPKPGVCKHSSI